MRPAPKLTFYLWALRAQLEAIRVAVVLIHTEAGHYQRSKNLHMQHVGEQLRIMADGMAETADALENLLFRGKQK